MFVIVAVFATICLTTLYYIPEISHPDEYNTVYKQFTGGTVRDQEPPLGAQSPATEPATSASRETETVTAGRDVVKQPVVVEEEKHKKIEVASPLKSQKKDEPPSVEDETKGGERGWEDTEKRDKVKEVWLCSMCWCVGCVCVPTCVCVRR